MTKIQKIWLGVFMAMFIVPEVLWSPLLGLLPFNSQFRSTDDHHVALTLTTFIQFIGLLMSAILIFKFAKFKWKNVVGFIVLLLAGWAFFLSYLLWATINFWH